MSSHSESQTVEALARENEELRLRLQEAEQAIEAIRSGGVDALIVPNEGEEQIYTLEGAETPYRSFVEHMLEGAVSMSLDGTLLYCNRRFAEIVGLPLEKILGRKFEEFATHPDLVTALLSEAQWGSSRGELTLHKLGNCGVPVFAALQRLAGETAELCMVVTDLTDIVAARLLVGELELRVDERTAALVAKNQELEGFTYSVSHDMRTPLRGIVGNANIVLEEEGERISDTGKEQLRRLANAAIKMAQLVDDLLQYARLGVRELKTEPINLMSLAQQVAKEVASNRGDCELTVSIPEDCTVTCDPRILGMALHNLFDNACKYRKRGNPMRMELGVQERFGESVYFVRDEGIGFDMTYVHKLFVPFERLHRDSDYLGTGIGLANVRRAIERHGGVVWAEGEPGVGATFYFTLSAAPQPHR